MSEGLLAQILDRGMIHLFSSAGVVLSALLVLRLMARRLDSPWLPGFFQSQVLLAAVCVFAGSALREAWDVHRGQSVIKAFADYASWAIGSGLSAWGLYRIRD
jgi:hypothetical protein